MIFPETQHASVMAEYCWLLTIDGRQLGVHLHNGWCMDIDGQMACIDEEYKCVRLLPLLERAPATFAAQLQLAEQTYPAFAASIASFPKLMLMKHVFHTSVSGYWPERALAWLADDASLQPALRHELDAFAHNKVMPQDLRQRAKRMLRNMPTAEPQPATMGL